MAEINDDEVASDIIQSNLEAINRRIEIACEKSDRDPKNVKLIVVTKNQSIQTIKNAIECGIKDFGENRLKHLSQMRSEIDKSYSDINWHFIGQIQKNKVLKIAEKSDYIHSVDKKEQLDLMSKIIKKPTLFLQIYTGNDPDRAGVALEKVPEMIARSLETGNKFKGLMILADPSKDAKNQFKEVYECAQENSLKLVSMGMSSDFETAIECGATHIRLGSAIFAAKTK